MKSVPSSGDQLALACLCVCHVHLLWEDTLDCLLVLEGRGPEVGVACLVEADECFCMMGVAF